MQINETRLLPSTIHRKNSKWIKDLNVALETIKILEENIAIKCQTFLVAPFFSDICPWAKKKRENKQVGLQQIKKFWRSKGNYQQNKNSALSGRVYLPLMHLIRGSYPKFIKNLENSTS